MGMLDRILNLPQMLSIENECEYVCVCKALVCIMLVDVIVLVVLLSLYMPHDSLLQMGGAAYRWMPAMHLSWRIDMLT